MEAACSNSKGFSTRSCVRRAIVYVTWFLSQQARDIDPTLVQCIVFDGILVIFLSRVLWSVSFWWVVWIPFTHSVHDGCYDVLLTKTMLYSQGWVWSSSVMTCEILAFAAAHLQAGRFNFAAYFMWFLLDCGRVCPAGFACGPPTWSPRLRGLSLTVKKWLLVWLLVWQ